MNLPIDFRNTVHGKLLFLKGYCVDIVNQATVPEASQRRERNRELLQNPALLHQIAELAEIPGITGDVLFKSMRQAQLDDFPEPEDRRNHRPSASQQHRYTGIDHLKAALAECFERLGIRIEDPVDDIFDVPLAATQVQAFGDVEAVMRSPNIDPSPLGALSTVLRSCTELDLWGVGIHDLFARTTAQQNIPKLVCEDRTFVLGRIFTTCTGLVGASLCALLPGDSIWILPSCHMPVALRPSSKVEGAYELLGGLFIPGMMDGEAIEGENVEDLKLRECVLC